MYRQFETFKNMPINEQLNNFGSLNKEVVLKWSEDVIEKIESDKGNTNKLVLQSQSQAQLDKDIAKITRNTNQLVKKEVIAKNPEVESNKEITGPILSKKVDIIYGAIPQDVKLKPDKKGVIISYIFVILLVISYIFIIKDREADGFTLMLLWLASVLVYISFCSLANKCFFGSNDSNWSQNKLGRQCTLKIVLYISAILTGLSVCGLIMIKKVVLNIGSYFTKL